MGGRLREVAPPSVVAGPTGARVRTRLRVTPVDAAVLAAAGAHLGSLASADLAARCREGRLDAKGRAVSRAVRKRAVTGGSSSRWAGAITRTSEIWQLADRNLRAERATLRCRIKRSREARVPAGTGRNRRRGYATQAERFEKQRRCRRCGHASSAWNPDRCRAVSVCRAGPGWRRPVTACQRPGGRRRDGGRSGTRNGGSSPPTARPGSCWGRDAPLEPGRGVAGGQAPRPLAHLATGRTAGTGCVPG